MDTSYWFLFAVIGRILISVWMKFELPFKNDWIEKIHECALCSGVWIYGVLALVFHADIFTELFTGHPVSIVGEIATAVVTSYIMFYFMIGWQTKHEVITV